MASLRAVPRLFQATMITLSILHTNGVVRVSPENSLIDDLFEAYNPIVRPLLDPTQPIHVNVSYFLISLAKVDEKAQTVSFNGFFQMTWKDELLTWTPADYANITSVFLPLANIWTPDVMLQNGIGDRFFAKDHYSPRLYYDGSIRWELGSQVDIRCDFSLRYYPFEEQHCRIEVATGAGADDHVKVYGGLFDAKTYFHEHGGWHVHNIQTANFSFSDDNESHSEVHFHFDLKRKSLSSGINVLLPVVLLSLLSGVVFLRPAGYGGKVSMSLNFLLCFTFLQFAVDSHIPSQSVCIPLLDVYIAFFLVYSGVAVMMGVISVRLYRRHDPITEAARKVLRWSARVAEYSSGTCLDRSRAATVGAAVDETMEDTTPDNEESTDAFSWSNVSDLFDRACCIVYYLFLLIAVTIVLVTLSTSHESTY